MLHSMTGFARQTGEHDDIRWTWEIRSVNGKGLDIRLRLPSGFEHLDTGIRKSANEKLSRGNLQISLSVELNQGKTLIAVNERALANVIASIEQIDASMQTTPSSAAQILSLRGVMEVTDSQISEEQRKVVGNAMLADFSIALQSLSEHRKSEGALLSNALLKHVRAIAALTESAEADLSHAPDTIKQKL